jgi:predicted O-linked N-acetylglucosamine transferase (SPINDLY family)
VDIEQTLKIAVEHHKAGRVIEAHKLYKQVLELHPDDPDALRLLGQLTYQAGNFTGAAALIRRAISHRPKIADFHIDLARVTAAQGKLDEAEASLKAALALDPFQSPNTQLELARVLASNSKAAEAITHVQRVLQKNPSAEAQALYGELLLSTGRVQQAVDRCKSAVDVEPNRADLRAAYAMALQHRGDFDLAEAEYRQAMRLDPSSAAVRNNLGYLLVLRKQLPQAILELKQAVALHPEFPQAHHNLALAHTGLGQLDDALASYRTALDQEPRFPEAWESLSRVLLDQRRYTDALVALNRLIALKPTSKAYLLMAVAHGRLEDLDSAITAAKKAVEISPLSSDAHDALGGELKWAGQLDAAMVSLRRALELCPTDHSAHSKLVYAMLMKDGIPADQILAEHRNWGIRHTGSIVPLRRPRNLPVPDRRLRIGYVSNNFRNQAVSSFILPIIRSHDRSAVEVYCYSDLEFPDDWTRDFQKHAHQWREIAGVSDEELARLIRADRIDILVELTGHIGRGRLKALAYRPAPVQISYIGYQGTTGVPAVDYVLTDDWADPPGRAEANYVEKPWRLPESFFVYHPSGDAPLVGPLPAKAAGHVTFGCLNAVCKATPRAVRLWARVMSEVPGSRMMLLTTRCAETDARLLAEFERGGISPSRLQLVQRSAPGEYFRRYNAIDIVLDPVPFNGHTTTCDAAWMGCPTVTLSGEIYAHRFGGSVMRNLGLADLVTESEEAYTAAAIGLARDLPRLEKIRADLRFVMQDSLITDGPRFTRNLEQAYRQMWHIWCKSQSPAGPAD